MYRVSIASDDDCHAVLQFLEERMPQNAWLLWSAYETLQHPEHCVRILVYRSEARIAGVAHLVEGIRQRSDWNPPFDYAAEMDAVDSDALAALTDAMPTGRPGKYGLFSLIAQRFFDALPDVKRSAGDLYFTVSREQFQPVEVEAVVEIKKSDAYLFQGCEREPCWEHRGEHSRLFAIMVDRKPVTSAWSGVITPREAVKQQVETICALYTETAYRHRGLARRLVSHLTQRILEHGNIPIYWTEPANSASQNLCKSLGYRQYAQYVTCLWRKP